jgi:branched-chain amino acid transport system permease protein
MSAPAVEVPATVPDVTGRPSRGLPWRGWWPGVAVFAALLAYPTVLSGANALNIGILALTYAIAATGWNLLGGYTGQVSFGHALYFGTGAYTTAMLVRHDWSPWLAIALSLPIAAAVSVIIGYPTFRLRRHYYSIATIAVAEIVLLLVNDNAALGAASGLELPITEPGLANLQFSLQDNRHYYYYVALGLFALAALAVALFLRGRAGSYVRAIRDDEEAAAAVGIPVRRYKLLAGVLSAAVTAVAGGFYVMFVSFVEPLTTLGVAVSVSFTLMAVLGGAGRFWGPLLGAWVLVVVQAQTRQHFSSTGRSIDLLLYGALIVAVAVTEPGGLIAIGERVRRAVARRLSGRRS